MSSVRMGRVRQAAVRKQLWELSEKEIKVALPYRTAATAEVIIVIESDVYDAVVHCNEWMDEWMDGDKLMDDDHYDDVEVI